MIPEQWAPPCNSQCIHKYTSLFQIPCIKIGRMAGRLQTLTPIRRVFCKKGCDADGETWDGCLGECDKVCYKDPVLKDKQWSAYIDRSPGSVRYSEECFRACVAGCSYKFDIPAEKLEQVHARPQKPPPEEKPRPPAAESRLPLVYVPCGDEVLNTSA